MGGEKCHRARAARGAVDALERLGRAAAGRGRRRGRDGGAPLQRRHAAEGQGAEALVRGFDAQRVADDGVAAPALEDQRHRRLERRDRHRFEFCESLSRGIMQPCCRQAGHGPHDARGGPRRRTAEFVPRRRPAGALEDGTSPTSRKRTRPRPRSRRRRRVSRDPAESWLHLPTAAAAAEELSRALSEGYASRRGARQNNRGSRGPKRSRIGRP